MKLTDDMPIHARTALLEDALAQILDRDANMEVVRGDHGERLVLVLDGFDHQLLTAGTVVARAHYSLHRLACELESLIA